MMTHRPPRGPARITVDTVRPQVDDGRHAVKRVVGEPLAVTAIAYRDGHDVLAGRIRFRGPGDRRWRTAPMTYERDWDRLTGTIVPDSVGQWQYTVEAWTDRYQTWAREIGKFLEAAVEFEPELKDGIPLFEEATRRAHGAARVGLKRATDLLAAAAVPVPERARHALSEEVAALMEAHLPPGDLTRYERTLPLRVDRSLAGFAAWYEMFPRSLAPAPGRHGTFRDAERRLPALRDLGFDVVYLPPIHPIGITSRKGANNALAAGPDDPGSPWAIGNADGGHTAVEPKLGTLEDFEHFVAAAGEQGLEVALDYALQCSPDHPWVTEHADWFFVRPDGSIRFAENPPKKYEDIVPLNFWCADYLRLWEACRDVLEFWIARGVRIFRVDNPHTKPLAFWEWLIAEVHAGHPDVIFLSEAFTRPARMKGLAKIGFTQSYTYFTWRNLAGELAEYFTELTHTETAEYFRGNLFTNTPDILHEYLQRGGRPAFRVRLLLAATLSPLYGIYSGFELCENTALHEGSEEYLHSEKYQVRVREFDGSANLNDDIRRINRIRREHPALQQRRNLAFHRSENERLLFYHRHAPGDDLLVVVNLDPFAPQETMVQAPLLALGLGENAVYDVEDLLTGARYTWRGSRNYVRLDPAREPGHVLLVRRPGEERAP
jgi:starch synthase (maltosyl-transferring)